jgi:hypothetical protein
MRFSNEENEVKSFAWRWAFWIVGFVLVIGLVGGVAGTFGTIFSAPGRVINKTLQTDNIINNYEWFYQNDKAIKARTAQIKNSLAELDSISGLSPTEKQRNLQDLQAMRQSCRDLVANYNARSQMINRSIFKGRDAPETQDPSICELQKDKS